MLQATRPDAGIAFDDGDHLLGAMTAALSMRQCKPSRRWRAGSAGCAGAALTAASSNCDYRPANSAGRDQRQGRYQPIRPPKAAAAALAAIRD